MRVDILTLFPDRFSVLAEHGVSSRALKKGLWGLHTWNPRDYTSDVHRTVDDRPYGGGPGMVMLAQPLDAALDDALQAREQAGLQSTPPVILLSPTGQVFTQQMAQTLASSEGAVFICGRYEGIDQRFIDARVSAEWSLGDFVLSGGELAAAAMIDSAVRLLPGALNGELSAAQDSFHDTNDGLLDSPHYTRPESYQGTTVPEVLLSGNHRRIDEWRRQQSLRITAARRPDLVHRAREQGLLTKADERFLKQLKGE